MTYRKWIKILGVAQDGSFIIAYIGAKRLSLAMKHDDHQNNLLLKSTAKITMHIVCFVK